MRTPSSWCPKFENAFTCYYTYPFDYLSSYYGNAIFPKTIPLLMLGSASSAFSETCFVIFILVFFSLQTLSFSFTVSCAAMCAPVYHTHAQMHLQSLTDLCAHKYSFSWSHVLLELPILFALFLQNPASQKSCPCFISSTSTHSSVYGLCQSIALGAWIHLLLSLVE